MVGKQLFEQKHPTVLGKTGSGLWGGTENSMLRKMIYVSLVVEPTPLKKICQSQNGIIFPNLRDENNKYLKFHHPVYLCDGGFLHLWVGKFLKTVRNKGWMSLPFFTKHTKKHEMFGEVLGDDHGMDAPKGSTAQNPLWG